MPELRGSKGSMDNRMIMKTGFWVESRSLFLYTRRCMLRKQSHCNPEAERGYHHESFVENVIKMSKMLCMRL